VTNALNRAALARLRDPGLAERIEGEAAFPNTMVDRIAPATRPDHLAHREARYGLRDAAPVFCERFTQWVIEDRFVAGRPEWEQAGAPFVPDVSPHEPMKLRLPNGGHLAIAAPGRLLGHTHLHEAMAEPRLRGFMAALMERERNRRCAPCPGVDLAACRQSLIARFANPAIQDRVERINQAASPNLLLLPIRASLAVAGRVDLLALARPAPRAGHGRDAGSGRPGIRRRLISRPGSRAAPRDSSGSARRCRARPSSAGS
jgi:mannitol-1-phosphate/altronate dehydrogenase